MEVSKALEAMQYALQEDEYEGYRSRLNEASAGFIRPLIAQLYLDVAMGNTDGPSYAEWTFLDVLSREELEDIEARADDLRQEAPPATPSTAHVEVPNEDVAMLTANSPPREPMDEDLPDAIAQSPTQRDDDRQGPSSDDTAKEVATPRGEGEGEGEGEGSGEESDEEEGSDEDASGDEDEDEGEDDREDEDNIATADLANVFDDIPLDDVLPVDVMFEQEGELPPTGRVAKPNISWEPSDMVTKKAAKGPFVKGRKRKPRNGGSEGWKAEGWKGGRVEWWKGGMP